MSVTPDYLFEAAKLIEEARDSLARQKRLIEMLEKVGRETAAANTVLAELERNLESLERQRKLLAGVRTIR